MTKKEESEKLLKEISGPSFSKEALRQKNIKEIADSLAAKAKADEAGIKEGADPVVVKGLKGALLRRQNTQIQNFDEAWELALKDAKSWVPTPPKELIDVKKQFDARRPAYSGSKEQAAAMTLGYTDDKISKMGDDELEKLATRIHRENALLNGRTTQLAANRKKEAAEYRDHSILMGKLDDELLKRKKEADIKRINDTLDPRKIAAREFGIEQQLLRSQLKQRSLKDLQFMEDARMKAAERTMKGPGIMGSGFGSFSIIMSGIAATLFVWQQVLGVITSVVAAGNDYDQTLRKIAGSSRLSQAGIGILDEKMRNMVKEGIDTKQIVEGFDALRARGLSVGDSMKYLEQTTKLARFGFVKMADAAEYVSTGNTRMIDDITKRNAAMEGGVQDKWDKFSGRMKLVAADFFKKEEPTFNRMLEDMSSWIDQNSETVVQELIRITDNLFLLGKGFAYALDFGIKYIDSVLNPLAAQAEKAAIEIETNKYKKQSKDIMELMELRESLNKIESKGVEADITFKDAKIKSTILKRIQQLEERNPNLRIPISDYVSEKFTPTGDKYNELHNPPSENLRNTNEDRIVDIAQLRTIWQQVLTKIGLVPKAMVAKNKLDLETTLANMGRADVEPKMQQEFAELTKWNEAQQEIAKQMETFKKLFETTGWTRQKYWDNEEDNIKFRMKQEVDYFRLTETEAAKQLRNEIEGVRIRREAPRVAVHEAIFADTGKMSGYLEKQKLAAIEHTRTKSELMEMGESREEAQRRANERAEIQKIKLSREKYSLQLADLEHFYTSSGDMSDKYYRYKINDINKETELYKAKNKDQVEEVGKWGKEMISKFQDSFFAPVMEKWEKYYSSIGVMSDQYYNLSIEKAEREAVRMEKIIGDEKAAQWLNREKTLIQSQFLGGSENPFDGIIAGMKEVEAQSKPIASTIANDWKDMVSSVNTDMKEAFYETFLANFDRAEDALKNVLKRMQRMVSDTFYEMMTKTLKEKMTGEAGQDLMKSFFGYFGVSIGKIAKMPDMGTPGGPSEEDVNRMGDVGMGGTWEWVDDLKDNIEKMADVGMGITKSESTKSKDMSIQNVDVLNFTVKNMIFPGSVAGGYTGGGDPKTLGIGSQIVNGVVQLVGKTIGSYFGTDTSNLGIGSSAYPYQPGGGSARGNLFNQFGMVAFGRGGVVSGPTLFPFARGTGLMGEAGPEAILPLSRGAGGVLGVRSEGGGGGGGGTSVIVHNYSGQPVQTRESNKGGMDKRTIEVMVGNAIASGGPASKAFESTYGLRRSGR